MQPISHDTNQLLERLAHAPVRLEQATRDVPLTRLERRSEEEPWSASDILAHLRACADLWGASMIAMITHDHPTIRYVSPRALMRKPRYQGHAFAAALASFTQERRKLVQTLEGLDEAGWGRRGTFTGTSPRGREQTVLSYADRLVSHELAHLEQLESLLR